MASPQHRLTVLTTFSTLLLFSAGPCSAQQTVQELWLLPAACHSQYGNEPATGCFTNYAVIMTEDFPYPATPGQWYLTKLAQASFTCSIINDKSVCRTTPTCYIDQSTTLGNVTGTTCSFNESSTLPPAEQLVDDFVTLFNCTIGTGNYTYEQAFVDLVRQCIIDTPELCAGDLSGNCYWDSGSLPPAALCRYKWAALVKMLLIGSSPEAVKFAAAYMNACPAGLSPNKDCQSSNFSNPFLKRVEKRFEALKIFTDQPLSCEVPKPPATSKGSGANASMSLKVNIILVLLLSLLARLVDKLL